MWTPNPTNVERVRVLLRAGVSPQTSSVAHAAVRRELERYSVDPEFAKTLAYLFAVETTTATPESRDSTSVRALAGLTLKNGLRHGSLLPTLKSDRSAFVYVHDAVPRALSSPHRLLRSAAGLILAQLVAKTECLAQGSSMIENLVAAVQQEEADLLSDGASLALMHIAEDAGDVLNSEIRRDGRTFRPLDDLVPLWIRLMNHPSPLHRERALDSLSCFLAIMPPALDMNVPAYLQGLSHLTRDPVPRIRSLVCQALCGLLASRPSIVLPHLGNVFDFIATSIDDEDERVAKEACYFLTCAADCEDAGAALAALTPFLPRVVPLLVSKIAYTEDDLGELEDQIKDDAHLPDRPDEISPKFFQSGDEGQGEEAGEEGLYNTNAEENDDEGNQENEEEGSWTLRRSAAQALAILSKAPSIKDTVLAWTTPSLERGLSSRVWTQREAAIMALGCVSEGCQRQLEAFVPTLLPLLLQSISDHEHTLVRKISCWTIVRFGDWLVAAGTPESAYASVVNALAERVVVEANKGVQYSAISAIADLIDKSPKRLILAVLPSLSECYARGLDRFQMNNLGTLYDAVSITLEALAREPHTPATEYAGFLSQIVPRLWRKFEATVTMGDPNLGPLTWAFAKLANVLGHEFPRNFAVEALGKCLQVAEEAVAMSCGGELVEEMGDLTYLVSVLELISALIPTLGGASSEEQSQLVRVEFPALVETVSGACADFLAAPDGDSILESGAGVLGVIAESAAFWYLLSPVSWRGSFLVLHGAIYSAQCTADYPPNGLRNALWAASLNLRLLTDATNASSDAELRASVLSDEELCGLADAVGSRIVSLGMEGEWARPVMENAALVFSRIHLLGLLRCRLSRESGRAASSLEAFLQSVFRTPRFVEPWTKSLATTSTRSEPRDVGDAYEGWIAAIETPSEIAKLVVPVSLLVMCASARCAEKLAGARRDLLERTIRMLGLLRDVLGPEQWMARLNELPPFAQRGMSNLIMMNGN